MYSSRLGAILRSFATVGPVSAKMGWILLVETALYTQ